jgi:membrane fusion protein, copper/silver efflux system
VRTGTRATVTLPAYPGVQLNGRVSYVDPQVTSETRTARVRVELQNARQLLRLGMYADVALSAPQTRGQPDNAAVTIPRAAVQTVGERSVVYVVHPEGPGRFVEREVALGPAIGERAQVLSGLKVGESIVVEGSFFLRAESERLGLR